MSDITLVGIGGLLGALLTLALGAVGLFLGVVLAITHTENRLERLVAYCAGPLACVVVGAGAYVFVGTLRPRDADDTVLVWPLVGIVSWGVIAVVLVVRRRREGPARGRRGD